VAMTATIDATGIHAPTYNEVLESLKENFRTIYGSDIYLEPDSQDGQFVSIFALAVSDANSMAIAAYNAFSPTTAVGAGLSSVVKINGIRRLIASYSSVVVTVGGVAGTIIENGIVEDDLNNRWLLPAVVVIPNLGQIDVTTVAETAGDIDVSPGMVTHIVTSFPGWQTVTNPSASVPGDPIEIDAELRRRQARSTAFPAQAIQESIYAGVANCAGVGRLQVYENWTGYTDSDGIPEHSIAVVVEGGNVDDIITAIGNRKTPGTGTYGDISRQFVDEHGVPNTINYFALTDRRVKVLVFLKAGAGYLSTTATMIRQAAAYWLTNQEVGYDSYQSWLTAPLELQGSAAMEATGRDQVSLNSFARTYNISEVSQNIDDMVVTGGPYVAGATAINILSINNISVGDTCYLTQDNGGFWKIVVSDVTGLTISFAGYAIPVGNQISAGSLVYLADDIAIPFTQATIADTTDITIVGG